MGDYLKAEEVVFGRVGGVDRLYKTTAVPTKAGKQIARRNSQADAADGAKKNVSKITGEIHSVTQWLQHVVEPVAQNKIASQCKFFESGGHGREIILAVTVQFDDECRVFFKSFLKTEKEITTITGMRVGKYGNSQLLCHSDCIVG